MTKPRSTEALTTVPRGPSDVQLHVYVHPLAAYDKHARYLSDWADDKICLDLTPRNSLRPNIRIFDMNEVTLNLEKGRYYAPGIVPIRRFPNLVSALKLAINNRLAQVEDGALHLEIPRLIASVVRFFVWMTRQGIYKLSNLSRSALNDFSKQLAKHGWDGLLDVDSALKALLARGDITAGTLQSVMGLESKVRFVTISFRRLSFAIGIPVSHRTIPIWFRLRLGASPEAQAKPAQRVWHEPVNGPNAGQLREALTSISCLAHGQDGVDGITFRPFASINELVRDHFGSERGGTPNLPLPQAVALFSECLRWVYDYRPTVERILSLVRSVADECERDGLKTMNTVLPGLLPRVHAELEADGIAHFSKLTDVYAVLNSLVWTSMAAAAALIAVNHGRRINEVVGYQRTHGLFRGCVEQPSTPNRGIGRIEMYVLKRRAQHGYANFFCNQLVIDAVALLEALDTLLSGDAKTDETQHSKPQRVALFRFRSFRHSFSGRAPFCFEWSRHSALLLEAAGIPLEALDGANAPFRRIFISLYVHRFDQPDLLALHRHIKHLRLLSLRPYFTDPSSRPKDAKLTKTLASNTRQEEEEVRTLLAQERADLLGAYIRRILEGDAIGGYFPRLVLALLRRLSSSLEFRLTPREEKARTVTNIILRRGYTAAEKPGGPCMAGTARQTKRHAKCFKDGELQTSDGSPSKCSGCIHSVTSMSTLVPLEADRDDAAAKSRDYRLSPALRLGFAEHAERMGRLIAAEAELGTDNQKLLADFIALWQDNHRASVPA